MRKSSMRDKINEPAGCQAKKKLSDTKNKYCKTSIIFVSKKERQRGRERRKGRRQKERRGEGEKGRKKGREKERERDHTCGNRMPNIT
jgi:hypothetical protein